ncbi:MAG: hypothetical protein AAGD35_18175 [Actinomycetota bacterium]
MTQRAAEETWSTAPTPLWRRATAFFTLGSLTVAIGVGLAAVIAATALLMLFVLERAIAG